MSRSATDLLVLPLRVGRDLGEAVARLPELVGEAVHALQIIDRHVGEVLREIGTMSRGVQRLATDLPPGIERLDARLQAAEAGLRDLREGISAVGDETVGLREAIERTRIDLRDHLRRVEAEAGELPATRAAVERLVADIEKVPGI